MALLGLWFWQHSISKYHAARSCRSYTPAAQTFPNGELWNLGTHCYKTSSPVPLLSWLAQGHPHCRLLHHLGNEPLLSISCPEWLSETCREHFIEVGKLESISISLAPRFYYFLWSDFSNTADKSTLKWTYWNACKNQKRGFLGCLLFCILHALACLFVFVNGKITSAHPQANGQTEHQNPRGKILRDC